MAAPKGCKLIAAATQRLGCASHVTLTTMCGVLQAKKVAAELSFGFFVCLLYWKNYVELVEVKISTYIGQYLELN